MITATVGFESSDDIRIKTHGDGLLRQPVELADFGSWRTVKSIAERVGIESVSARRTIHLERGRWHLSQLIRSSSVLTAREWHGQLRPRGEAHSPKHVYGVHLKLKNVIIVRDVLALGLQMTEGVL